MHMMFIQPGCNITNGLDFSPWFEQNICNSRKWTIEDWFDVSTTHHLQIVHGRALAEYNTRYCGAMGVQCSVYCTVVSVQTVCPTLPLSPDDMSLANLDYSIYYGIMHELNIYKIYKHDEKKISMDWWIARSQRAISRLHIRQLDTADFISCSAWQDCLIAVLQVVNQSKSSSIDSISSDFDHEWQSPQRSCFCPVQHHTDARDRANTEREESKTWTEPQVRCSISARRAIENSMESDLYSLQHQIPCRWS